MHVCDLYVWMSKLPVFHHSLELICVAWFRFWTGNLVMKVALPLPWLQSISLPGSSLTHSAHALIEAHFLTSLLSLPPRPTLRGIFCWRLWRSTTRWGQTRLQPPWARSTTLPPRCLTTRGSSTGSRVWRERPAASAWTGTHTWRKRGCGDAPLSSKSKSQTWLTWTPSIDGHG